MSEQPSEKIMDLVANLLAKAEHPNTPPPEAELCLLRANKLILRHAIDEAMLRASQSEDERRKPVVEKWTWLDSSSEYTPYFRSMLVTIAGHNRCKAAISYGNYQVTMVGFSEDVSWCQLLYMNCYHAFLSALMPKWDMERSIDENVYNFKRAGYKWNEIFDKLARAHGYEPAGTWDQYWPDDRSWYTNGIPCLPVPNDGGYMIRAYKRWAKKIGDEQRITTQRHGAYRRTFAEAFAVRINARLEKMAREAEEEINTVAGNAVALRDAWQFVEAAFYDEFPEMHPDEMRRRNEQAFAAAEAARKREAEARAAMMEAMTPKQRNAFLEKEERARRAEARSNNAYWRDADRRNRGDLNGQTAGRAAADSVSLSRGGPGVQAPKTAKEIG